MRVLVVDDEPPARERLRRLVAELPDCEVVGEAGDGATAVRLAEEREAEVVLLDVRMPGVDGIEAARHLGHAQPPPAIIFTTAYTDHALEAFETPAVDYLVKPVRRERLAAALRAARRPNRAQVEQARAGEPRQRLCARLGGRLELVAVDAVRYFRAEQKYVTVRHGDGEVLIEESLKALEREFGDRFLRVHRKALVAPAWVGGLQRMDDGRAWIWFHDIDDTVEVSRRHLPAVRERLRMGQ